jgi:8-oxo-dGTP pyrophosphatase MutT (NUDIX family)
MTLPLAAAREVEEETGLTGELLPDVVALSRHRAPCRPGIVDWHLDVQHVLVVPGRPVAGPLPFASSEAPRVAWWPVAELPAPVAPGVLELVGRASGLLAGRQEAGSF